jgi:transcription factor SPT20
LIVEVHDHKSITTTRDTSQITNSAEKTEPFSIHKWNDHLTPSSWVPYPKKEPPSTVKTVGPEVDAKQKSAMEKDKENMPAPNQPVDSHRTKATKKPKISTIVLHPTDLTLYTDIAIKASTPLPIPLSARRESRVDIRAATPMSASGLRPQTPMIAIPPTPHVGMEPPAKRVKRDRMELEGKTIHAFEGEVLLLTTAPLVLDAVDSAGESARLLEALTHPEHSSKVPSPKARKKTVAEMAAEESAAANDEQYMLILDERLSSNNGAAGAANPGDGDGQAGSASWEPRFERFKAIESIKLQSVENKKKEKMQQAEQAKRQQQEGEAREKARQEGIKRQQEDEHRQRLLHMQQQQQQRQQQQEQARRQMVAQSQQNQPNIKGQHPQIPQAGVQHGHPAQNVIPNGIAAGQQRLIQQQQFTQAQASSPVVRNATPHNLSSPMVATNVGVQMQHSNSGMGGSPPRPGSVVQQGHQQMTPAMAQAMRTQGSQNSQGGTPRLPSATPNMSQPIPRPMNQTPRMSQSSPMPGHMAQTPLVNNAPMMMQNNQMTNIQLQQAQQIAAQARMRQAAAQQAMGSSPPNGQQMTPQQFAMQQMHQQQQANPGMMSGGQMSAQYAAQMSQMAAVRQAALQNGNPNFMAANGMHPQMVQAQQVQQVQLQGQQQQMSTMSNMQRNVQMVSQKFYQQGYPQLSAQYNGQIPPDVNLAYRQSCNARAQQFVGQQMRTQQMRAQQSAMAQNMNMNGMGMQRPPGM